MEFSHCELTWMHACSQSISSGFEAQEHPCEFRLQAENLRFWIGAAIIQRHAYNHLLDRLCGHSVVPSAGAVRLFLCQVLPCHRHLEHRLHLCGDPAGEAPVSRQECRQPVGAHHRSLGDTIPRGHCKGEFTFLRACSVCLWRLCCPASQISNQKLSIEAP